MEETNKDSSIEIIEMQYMRKDNHQDQKQEREQAQDQEEECKESFKGKRAKIQAHEQPVARNAEAYIEYKKEIKSMSYSDRFKAFFSNATYNIKGFTKSAQKKVKLNQKRKEAWLFNQNYSFNPQKPEEALSNFLKHHEQIIWFSYRNNFPMIRDVFDESQSASNDYGWGCMIRCSQMLLAETLKRHFQQDFSFSYEKLLPFEQHSFFKTIIRLFLDCTSSASEEVNPNEVFSIFGIQSICNKALLHRYQTNVKNWYTSIQVCVIFQEILEESQKIGTKTPLKIINFTDSIVFYKELDQAAKIAVQDEVIAVQDKVIAPKLETSTEKNTLNKKEEKIQFKRQQQLRLTYKTRDDSDLDQKRKLFKTLSCQDFKVNEKPNNSVSEQLLKKPSQNKDSHENNEQEQKHDQPINKCNLLVMIHMKFGIQQFELEHKKYFFELISLPGFIGALSGTDTKGMYIVGHQDSRVIVLDPHYVQEATMGFEGLDKDYSTYFNKIPRCLEVDQLSSDISIGFFVNASENNGINDFIDSIYDLNQHYSDPLLCVLMDRVEVNQSAEEEDYFQGDIAQLNTEKEHQKNKEINIIKEESKEFQDSESLIQKSQIEGSFFISNGSCLSDSNSLENKKIVGTTVVATDFEVIS